MKCIKVVKSKYKYNKLKNFESVNEQLLMQEYLVVVIKTCYSKDSSSSLSVYKM